MHSSWPSCRPHRWDLKCSAEHGVRVRGDEQEYQVFLIDSVPTAQIHRCSSISPSLLELIMNMSARKAVPTENCSKFHFICPKFCCCCFFFFNLVTLTLALESVCSTAVSLFFSQQLETASGLWTHHASNRCYADRISRTEYLLESDRGRSETARLCILAYVTIFVH